MSKLDQMAATATHRVLLFGAPKTGKTLFSLSLAESGYDILYIGMENGHGVGHQLSQEAQSRIEVINLPDTRLYPIAVETCLKLTKPGKCTICEAHGKVSCLICCKPGSAPETHGATITVDLDATPSNTIVVFDSLTQLTNSVIANITKNEADEYKVDWDGWAVVGKLMDKFLSRIQQAGYNVICISHETEVKMEDGKDKLVGVAGTRNFSRNSAKYFDTVVYCEVKNKKHVLGSSTLYSGNILTGSRENIVLEGTEKPSLLPIFKGAAGKASTDNKVAAALLQGMKKS